MEYRPDGWHVIKLTDKDSETHYRVFANWYGGYLHGDSWKLNSGIVKVNIENDVYSFVGDSGSTYFCNINQYKLSAYGSSVLNSLIERSKETITIEVLTQEQMVEMIKTEFKGNV